MKILFLISSLLVAAVAQQPSLSCIYFIYYGYGCQLTINNPDGLNNFTEIGGIHFEGHSNANVTIIYRLGGVSPNVPNIICETFPNLEIISFDDLGLTEIDDQSFAGCTRAINLNLYSNSIRSISENAFVNLPNIDSLNLERNLFETLPENVFASQRELTLLDLNENDFDVPVGLFRPLENLQILYFGYANLTEINSQWFSTNSQLRQLYLTGNRFTVLSEDSFIGLEGLETLDLTHNVINQILPGAFARLSNIRTLSLYNNNFTELQPDSFPDLSNLEYLDLSLNPIEVIHDGAFRGLVNLIGLYMQSGRIREVHSDAFEDLEDLVSLSMNYNEIEELPQGLFVPTPNLVYFTLRSNRLKTLRRNSFGILTNLATMGLDGNVVNAVERAFIDDAVNLDTLYFSSNLCANSHFGNFQSTRNQYLQMLERCFSNFRYSIETVTEGDNEYSFFEGPNPGIAFRVNSDSEIQVALTPFNFLWTPSIEILIGTTNNTRSTIRMNEETDVVTVPTPNIISRNQWNDFRITWANQVILVYRGSDTLPFMTFTMQHFFPVNFYGLRSLESRASWTVQPFTF